MASSVVALAVAVFAQRWLARQPPDTGSAPSAEATSQVRAQAATTTASPHPNDDPAAGHEAQNASGNYEALTDEIERQRAEIVRLEAERRVAEEQMATAAERALADAERARVEQAERSRAEERALVESVNWTQRMCADVARAVMFDYARALSAMDAHIRRGQALASDHRLINALQSCNTAALDAWTAVGLRDQAEARRIMTGVYAVWNRCRESLDLEPVRLGGIPEDAQARIDARDAAARAEVEAALAWSDDACKRVDTAVEADAERLTRVSRSALRSFLNGWHVSQVSPVSPLIQRDRKMRKLYEQWNSHREHLGLRTVPYGELPDGEVLAVPRDRK